MRSAQSEDLSLDDLEQFLCAPYGLRFEQLAGLPPARSNGRWTCIDLVPYLTGLMRGLAPMQAAFQSMVAAEAALRPDASVQEQRERALDRFTQVGVARVLLRRPPA
jgi:hypothetical protein